jgi:hypothetical protein
VKFWLPEVVAAPPLKTLSILVNGTEIGSVPLTRAGMNEIALPVAARLISERGFTIVDLNVDRPYQQKFGVVLASAGFEYRQPTQFSK